MSDTTEGGSGEWEVRAPTPDENMWFTVREEAIRQRVPRLNDALARLLTLSTALAGGSLLWLRDVCGDWFRLSAAVVFVGAVVVSMLGTIPYAASGPADPVAIESRYDRADAHKRRLLWWAFGLTVGGLVVAITGSLLRVAFGI